MRSFIFSLALVTAVAGTMNSTRAADATGDTAQIIAKNLKESGKLQDYRVGVKYEDGVAWLMGTVTSPQQKEIAERLARQSAGVDHVVSKLEVERAANAPKADKQVQIASREMPAQRRATQRPRNSRPRQNQARQNGPRNNMPVPYARTGGMPQGFPQGRAPQQRGPQQAGPRPGVQPANFSQAQYCPTGGGMGGPGAMGPQPPMGGGAGASHDNPQLPGYAWPSYAASPNYAAVTYPKQYSASAWPYIGPFYPYPQVPLGWRKVTLEWDDGWWNLDFSDCKNCK